MDTSSNDSDKKEILQYLKSIEARISKIESQLDISQSQPNEQFEEEPVTQKKSESEEELELRIGQFWFAKLGIFVFLVGWLIGNTLPFENLNQLIPVIIGFVAGVGVIGISVIQKNKLPHLSGWLLGSGFALIYIASLRTHFFGHSPLITDIIPVLMAAYFISIILIFLGIKWGSSYITSFGLATVFLSALLGDYPYLIFLTLTGSAVLAANLKLKYNWNGFFNYVIVLTYLVHLIWFINNPLTGNQLMLQIDEPLNLLFILLYQIIFTIPFIADKKYEELLPTGISILMNTSGGYGLFLLITILSTPALGQVYHLIASIIFIAFAILFYSQKSSKAATFFYAMTGYGALSIAIILQFDKPDFFTWLCWQSLIVVSTAVWFRSKFIIVANFIIFLIIFLVFLALSATTSVISLSFGIVALLSARILNWKKGQLELKTEQMRNAYLLTAFLIIPYSLYNMMPSGYVAFSWIVVAVLYYVFSLLLKNVKYRYMSLGTFLLTVIYVFVLGITSEETVFKILSFLVLGTALIILSIIYTRNRNKILMKKEMGKS